MVWCWLTSVCCENLLSFRVWLASLVNSLCHKLVQCNMYPYPPVSIYIIYSSSFQSTQRGSAQELCTEIRKTFRITNDFKFSILEDIKFQITLCCEVLVYFNQAVQNRQTYENIRSFSFKLYQDKNIFSFVSFQLSVTFSFISYVPFYGGIVFR